MDPEALSDHIQSNNSESKKKDEKEDGSDNDNDDENEESDEERSESERGDDEQEQQENGSEDDSEDDSAEEEEIPDDETLKALEELESLEMEYEKVSEQIDLDALGIHTQGEALIEQLAQMEELMAEQDKYYENQINLLQKQLENAENSANDATLADIERLVSDKDDEV